MKNCFGKILLSASVHQKDKKLASTYSYLNTDKGLDLDVNYPIDFLLNGVSHSCYKAETYQTALLLCKWGWIFFTLITVHTTATLAQVA